MQRFTLTLLGSLALASPALTRPALAQAENWPTRSVRVVVPTAARGALDQVARQLGQRLGERFGQSMVIENRGGGAGVMGWTPSRRPRQTAIRCCLPPHPSRSTPRSG